ncbi:MAG: aminotransferase class III-fold pyridoxal phosphate-dependent enzyme [Acidobacteria bacterium]|nr:aminotransferase class III-fold pyridoxal phosphate-dependent enzyme [Acidobacteriota bacterium]
MTRVVWLAWVRLLNWKWRGERSSLSVVRQIKSALPGARAQAILEKDARMVSPSYTRPFPLVIKRGFGAIIEHFDFVPDIMTIAKGIASGLPLSATVARADLMQWHEGAHASTFGGNPVSIAAAMATIDLMEEGLLDNCQAMGQHLIQGLKSIADTYCDRIADVRGWGLMIGVEFVKDRGTLQPDRELRDRIVMECFKRGLVVIGCGHSTIRFSPPLVIDAEQADCALSLFNDSIAAAIEA